MIIDDTKNLLLSKAIELISKKGSYTISELTKVSHVNIAAVNYHFGSKDNLSREIVTYIVSQLREGLNRYLARLKNGETFEDFMEDLITELYEYTLENVYVFQFMFFSDDTKDVTNHVFYEAFFGVNDYTTMMSQGFAQYLGTTNPKEVFARYVIVFATAIMGMISPIFKQDSDARKTFSDPEFRKIYVKQMLKLLH